MNPANTWFRVSALAAAFALPTQVVTAADTKPDPRRGYQTYYGTGTDSRAYDFAQVFVTYSVNCKENASDAIGAIGKARETTWNSISKHVTDKQKAEPKLTEDVLRTFWNEVGNVNRADGAYIQQPNMYNAYTPRKGGVAPAVEEAKPKVAKRINSCTGKEIGMTDVVADIFSASQTIGIRSSDLGWVEGLARKVQSLKTDTAKDAVQISVSFSYGVTAVTQRDIDNQILDRARTQATGPDSQFAADAKDLKFANAFFKGHSLAYPPVYQPIPGAPYKPGEAPIATLTTPFTFRIYAEASDKVDSKNTEKGPVESSYAVTTTASAPADYATSSVTVSVGCQKNPADATKVVNAATADLVAEISKLYTGKTLGETTGYIEHEGSGGQRHDGAFTPVEFDAQGVPTKYLDICENKVKDGCKLEDFEPYYYASRQITMNSPEFEAFYKDVKAFQSRFGVNKTAGEIQVVVTDPTSAVTEKTTAKLQREARKKAAACINEPNGQLATDAKANGFSCVFLKDLQQGNLSVQRGAMNKSRAAAADFSGAALESAPGGAPSEPELLEVTEVVKDPASRPQKKSQQTFAFNYEILTENYVAPAKTAVTPEGPTPLP
jgi:hypothetical protein